MNVASNPVVTPIEGPSLADAAQPSRLLQIWYRTPDWLFRVLGGLFCLGCVAYRLPAYFRDFWGMGPYYVFADGSRLQLPWTRVLIDSTMLLLGFSYCFRLPAKSQVSRFRDVAIALLGGFWPMLPFAFGAALMALNPSWAYQFQAALWPSVVTLESVVLGASLIIIGNAIDVSSYWYLFRSFSIVPEARELITKGPYRLVRHPVYLGQLIAQAGVWLVFARLSPLTLSFFLVFIGIQLYRAKLEDQVLHNAFGDDYQSWKTRTFWFTK
ncbi:methyltransferase family protein [Thalassoroseus pseudoceratinae]|uniref:methyltransferase family protein n=1 Tax=Thalassoroseus pseudoceratinae TaxID=2713176 RepID=UPI00141FD3B8|nr:methyltransferase [Thalassoroseus pseudoceratinae]